MKLVDHFATFLADTVNLNSTRIDDLDASVEALKDAIRDSEWGAELIEFQEQGSWAHRTIIRPVDGNAFDADLLVVVDPVEGWDAKSYISTLRSVFAAHGTYKDKVRRFSHCVTIEYAGERKVDLAPCVRDRIGTGGHEVCNYNSNQFERSEPEAYTSWLRERNAWTGGNGLRKVTRLLKYLRDIKGNFTCPSILLTTLLGMQVTVLDSLNKHAFPDTPTALRTVVGRLDDWLQSRPTKPSVTNPVLSSEIFSDLWSEDQYGNFRAKINLYRNWIDEAFDEPDRDESIGKWRRIFGDDFASSVVSDKAARVTEAARFALAGAAIGSHDDLVTLVTRFGLAALPPGFNVLPHKARPRWRSTPYGGFSLVTTASIHSDKFGARLADAPSGGGPLRKGSWIHFDVRAANGAKFPEDKYRVYWRIANTDREALEAQALRGGFERANDGSSHWEGLEYRGVHTAEAFVVRRNDRMLVGQSEPFYVVIA